MPVIGFNIRSIRAQINEKKARTPGLNVNINSTPSIEGIEKKDLEMEGVSDVLSVTFKFATKYEPDIGGIEFEGEVLYQTRDTKKILKMWKDKKLDDDMGIEVLNAIFRRCLSRAVQIAEELRLPPPVTFPSVKKPE